jgi:hypothetical protein
MKNKSHWFVSPPGYMFSATKVLDSWRFIGQNTYIIKEMNKISQLKTYVKKVFGFEYVGYM